MIDISHYINKLELLKEWLSMKIDNKVRDMVEVEMTMDIFNRYGLLYFRGGLEMKETQRMSTFEEYHNSKTIK